MRSRNYKAASARAGNVLNKLLTNSTYGANIVINSTAQTGHTMKNLYRITNKNGVTICMQVASSTSQARDFARMYGHRGVAHAEFVREN